MASNETLVEILNANSTDTTTPQIDKITRAENVVYCVVVPILIVLGTPGNVITFFKVRRNLT